MYVCVNVCVFVKCVSLFVCHVCECVCVCLCVVAASGLYGVCRRPAPSGTSPLGWPMSWAALRRGAGLAWTSGAARRETEGGRVWGVRPRHRHSRRLGNHPSRRRRQMACKWPLVARLGCYGLLVAMGLELLIAILPSLSFSNFNFM